MEFSETRVVIFQVSKPSTKIKRIVETVTSHFIKKERFILFVENETAAHYVDELLWKVPEYSFLPHIVADDFQEENILITKTKKNLNSAPYAFNLRPTPLLLSDLKVIYDFEDFTTSSKKELSSLRFNAYKAAKAHLVALSDNSHS